MGPEQVVTREDVTKEIMANYQVESKIGWKQRVEEWLGSQPNVAPPCNSNDKENGNETQEAEEATSRSIQEKKQLKKQKLSKSRKEFQNYKKSKTPTSSGVQGKRKFTSISRGKAKTEKPTADSESIKEEKVQKKRRKKEGPKPSAAFEKYAFASGENSCKKC